MRGQKQEEAVGTGSDQDFIRKIEIVFKQLQETCMALRIIKKGNLSKVMYTWEKG